MAMWLSVDPMADNYPSISPYAYCAWNPVKLVDPDGRKDRPFRQGIDKEVSENIKTRTPVYIYNDIGEITDLHPDYKSLKRIIRYEITNYYYLVFSIYMQHEHHEGTIIE